MDSEQNGTTSKEPMYKTDPGDSKPVARRTVCVTVAILCIICGALLICLIMSLNGTIPPVNNVNYIRPGFVSDMDSYEVVGQTAIQCQKDMPITITTLAMSPHPLIVDQEITFSYDFSSATNVSADLSVHLIVQRLEPPWRKLECKDGMGSCDYTDEQACEMVATILGKDDKKDCEIKKGVSKGSTPSLMIGLKGALGWANTPGNYFVQAKLNYREQSFGCVEYSFRVKSK